MPPIITSIVKSRWLRGIGSWFVVPIALVVLAFILQGRSIAEKTATELMTPVTLIWWTMLVLAFKLWQSNRHSGYAVMALALFMNATCAPISSRFVMHFLETRIPTTPIGIDSSLDTLVVLGGGTSEAPDGRAQLAVSGDRVGLAMQLYHSGLVKRLVVTGDALKGLQNGSKNDPSIQSKRILLAMGVPESAIEEISGSNTSEEIRCLQDRSDLWRGKRCGLLTSAFHMPRAYALTRKYGVDVLPVLADYRILESSFGIRDLLPSAGGAMQSDLVIREYLGMLVGR